MGRTDSKKNLRHGNRRTEKKEKHKTIKNPVIARRTGKTMQHQEIKPPWQSRGRAVFLLVCCFAGEVEQDGDCFCIRLVANSS